MFENIAIIGCGLIGSSILRAINKNNISKNITVYDKSKEVLLYLKKENLNAKLKKDLPTTVANADLIIIAAPLSSYEEIISSIKDSTKKNAILTDTGSAKIEINIIIEKFNLKDISWIASHPIAGTEDSGPEAGFAELFENRWSIISPSEKLKKVTFKK